MRRRLALALSLGLRLRLRSGRGDGGLGWGIGNLGSQSPPLRWGVHGVVDIGHFEDHTIGGDGGMEVEDEKLGVREQYKEVASYLWAEQARSRRLDSSISSGRWYGSVEATMDTAGRRGQGYKNLAGVAIIRLDEAAKPK